MEECFKLFDIAYKVTNSIESIYFATKSVIEEFANDNVVYLELRTTPREENNMTEQQYIETVIKAIKDNKEHKIIVKLLLSINRRFSFQQQSNTLANIIKYKKLYPEIIKGIDLSGNPAKGSFHKSLFQSARDNSLLTAIHCGEIKNDNEVEEMLNFQPDRIGHATFLHPSYGGSEKNWEIYKSHKIPTEICLTSNVICGTPKTYKEHHVQEWVKESLPFCLNTDDKGVFNTSLSNELFLAHQHLSFDKRYLWEISYKTIDYTFASNEEKEHLRAKLNEWKLKHVDSK